jgi:hypothetical protein
MIYKARQGNANIFNVLILYIENLCVGDNIIKKQINKAVKVRMLVTGCSGYTRQGKASQGKANFLNVLILYKKNPCVAKRKK